MTQKRKISFRGRAARSMEKSKNAYGYLKLPSDINAFKPEGGTEVTFDIVPYPVTDPEHMDNKKHSEDAAEGDFWWKRPIRVHRDVGPDQVQIICPTTVGQKCPICEYGSKLRKGGAEWDTLKDIFPKDRTLYFIVLVDASECETDYTEGELHVLDQSDHLFLNPLDEELDRDIDNEDFANPYEGLSMTVFFRKKKFGKNYYAETSKIDFVERDEQYDDEFLDEVPSLDDMLEILEYKEIEALMGQEDLDDEIDEDDIEEERPVRKKRPAQKRKPRKEPEEVEEEEDDEEEEEKKTTRRKPTAKNPKEEEKKTTRRKPQKKDDDDNRCPYGHEFGVDAGDFNDCAKCTVWDDCMDEKEAK